MTETIVFQLTQPAAFARGRGVRGRVGQGSEPICFSSGILPPRARRSKSLEVLIALLYLKIHRFAAGHQPSYACTDDSRGWNRW